MAIEMKNGATVSRFYSDGSGELLAVFQYVCDADRWAAMRVREDAKDGISASLYRTCLYSGQSAVFHPPAA